MAKSTVEKSSARLKTVLDVLAEGTWSEKSLNAGEILAEAIVRVPLDERESELLSGGIPRGHKNLTTETAKLVKAGWLVKGRSGWTITDDGLRATVAFAKPDEFVTALTEGTPVPADTPLPTAPVKKAAARKPAAKKAPAAEKAPVAQSGSSERPRPPRQRLRKLPHPKRLPPSRSSSSRPPSRSLVTSTRFSARRRTGLRSTTRCR